MISLSFCLTVCVWKTKAYSSFMYFEGTDLIIVIRFIWFACACYLVFVILRLIVHPDVTCSKREGRKEREGKPHTTRSRGIKENQRQPWPERKTWNEGAMKIQLRGLEVQLQGRALPNVHHIQLDS